MKKLKILWIILFITAIIFSMFTVMYCLQYDVLNNHDMVFVYGRRFLDPEHGRYLSTFTSHILIEVLPEIFNIHPNDFSTSFIASIKGILIIISCLVIANTAFLFSKDNNKNILKFPVQNPCFTVVYMLIFLLLFNNNFFLNENRAYFAAFESIVFFEYPMSIVLYAAVMSIFGYYFINSKIPNKITFIVFLILLFLLGITVEPVNLPALAGFVLFLPYLIMNRKKLKDTKVYIILICIVYAISLFCYYIRPSEHTPDYYGTFLNYLKTAIIPFFKAYFNEFIINNSKLVLPSLLLFIPALFISKEKAKKMIYFVIANMAGFWCFYLLVFFIGYYAFETFCISADKWIEIYRVITLFYFIFVIGFIFDSYLPKISNILKIITCIFIFTIFHTNLITEYFNVMQETLDFSKEMRKTAYIMEKIAVSSNINDNTLIVPKKFIQYNDYFWFTEDGSINPCGYNVYLHNIYPKINKTQIIFAKDDSIIENIQLDDKELEQLKFSNLLKEKMYRHKKFINGCY